MRVKDTKLYKKYTRGLATYGKPTVYGREEANLIIGSYCSIAVDVKILLGCNHRVDWVTTYPFRGCRRLGHPSTKGDVVIGNDVWIGMGAVILSGVTIGDGAVIGAYSVVSRSVEPYGIAIGNPAKVVKKRFTDDQIKGLLKIKWWEWDPIKIKNNMKLILSNNIDAFIKAHSG